MNKITKIIYDICIALVAGIIIALLTPSTPILILLLCAIIGILIGKIISKSVKEKELKKNKGKALEICETFNRIIVPKFNSLMNYERENQFFLEDRIMVDETSGEIYKPIFTEREMEILKYILDESMVIFNELDLFAAKILELSDDVIDYARIHSGNIFCDTLNYRIRTYKLMQITHKGDYQFLNILYERWSNDNQK